MAYCRSIDMTIFSFPVSLPEDSSAAASSFASGISGSVEVATLLLLSILDVVC